MRGSLKSCVYSIVDKTLLSPLEMQKILVECGSLVAGHKGVGGGWVEPTYWSEVRIKVVCGTVIFQIFKWLLSKALAIT